jgi:hypothetical protein
MCDLSDGSGPPNYIASKYIVVSIYIYIVKYNISFGPLALTAAMQPNKK